MLLSETIMNNNYIFNYSPHYLIITTILCSPKYPLENDHVNLEDMKPHSSFNVSFKDSSMLPKSTVQSKDNSGEQYIILDV